MTIGQRIAKCRREKNLSQEYIAEALSVTRQAVSKWETDVNSPDTHNLIKLARLFGVSVEYLACGDGDDGETADFYGGKESAENINSAADGINDGGTENKNATECKTNATGGNSAAAPKPPAAKTPPTEEWGEKSLARRLIGFFIFGFGILTLIISLFFLFVPYIFLMGAGLTALGYFMTFRW